MFWKSAMFSLHSAGPKDPGDEIRARGSLLKFIFFLAGCKTSKGPRPPPDVDKIMDLIFKMHITGTVQERLSFPEGEKKTTLCKRDADRDALLQKRWRQGGYLRQRTACLPAPR
jgi:hypothetical protein